MDDQQRAVEQALAELERLAELPLAEHPELLSQIHEQLHAILNEGQ